MWCESRVASANFAGRVSNPVLLTMGGCTSQHGAILIHSLILFSALASSPQSATEHPDYCSATRAIDTCSAWNIGPGYIAFGSWLTDSQGSSVFALSDSGDDCACVWENYPVVRADRVDAPPYTTPDSPQNPRCSQARADHCLMVTNAPGYDVAILGTCAPKTATAPTTRAVCTARSANGVSSACSTASVAASRTCKPMSSRPSSLQSPIAFRPDVAQIRMTIVGKSSVWAHDPSGAAN